MNRILAALLVLSLFISGCTDAVTPIANIAPTLAPTVTFTPELTQSPTIPAAVIDGDQLALFVEPRITHQTIKDVTGGNFINVFSGTTDPTEPVSRYNLVNLPVRAARLRLTLEQWEPVNDDSDPADFNWDSYQNTEYIHVTFLLMQKLKARGTEIIATRCDLPDWLASDPSKKAACLVKYANNPELVEVVAAWLVHARDRYSVEPDYVSFNEPEGRACISIAPFKAARLIEQAGKRFDELGIKTKWLIADTANLDGRAAFAQSILKQESIRPDVGVFANHCWDSDSPDDDYTAVRACALENNLEVWCTETGSHAFSWQTPEKFQTHAYVVELARIYSRGLKLTGANAILYGEMLGSDYWINDGAIPYPSFHVIRQLGEQIPPGSVIVETSNPTEYFYSVAGQAPDHMMVFIVKTGDTPLTVTVEDLPAGTYTHLQTTEAELESIAGTYAASADRITLKIPGLSYHVLTTRTP